MKLYDLLTNHKNGDFAIFDKDLGEYILYDIISYSLFDIFNQQLISIQNAEEPVIHAYSI